MQLPLLASTDLVAFPKVCLANDQGSEANGRLRNGSKSLEMQGSDSKEVGHRGGLGSDMLSHVCGQAEADCLWVYAITPVPQYGGSSPECQLSSPTINEMCAGGQEKSFGKAASWLMAASLLKESEMWGLSCWAPVLSVRAVCCSRVWG